MARFMDRRQFLGAGGLAAAALAIWPWAAASAFPFALSDAEWRKRLGPLAYNVLRRKATEYPFTSPLNKEHRAGTFTCAGCDQRLFSSKTKFDSGTGWPSFWAPLPRAVATSRDFELGYSRTEVHCSRCGGHLGHVFDDGPKPTGKRYCMNGVALAFVPD
ncbi:peptide-methionine (R)-S-oxide reductase MsrB [Sphingobium sp. EM0848]|uniref:peptide-methionine (R)-S-oxide reductase MsrB n=1 Tax=Sphingobium sp. EM0848 TaxID=2743473 RepID=UPI0021016DCD|nr:peptide-methionine (R)-S-oxide reductase MsrB [Sphingobium sp. EM0848]